MPVEVLVYWGPELKVGDIHQQTDSEGRVTVRGRIVEVVEPGIYKLDVLEGGIANRRQQ